MLAIVERLARDLHRLRARARRDPKMSIYRIYRDTRFSEDKTPYKTHVAAVFPRRGLAKHEGAGLYFHVAPDEVWIGGGMYSPQTSQLQAVREHIAANAKRLRASSSRLDFRAMSASSRANSCNACRAGFAKDHPAAEF